MTCCLVRFRNKCPEQIYLSLLRFLNFAVLLQENPSSGLSNSEAAVVVEISLLHSPTLFFRKLLILRSSLIASQTKNT